MVVPAVRLVHAVDVVSTITCYLLTMKSFLSLILAALAVIQVQSFTGYTPVFGAGQKVCIFDQRLLSFKAVLLLEALLQSRVYFVLFTYAC
jgi:hypothetical protein